MKKGILLIIACIIYAGCSKDKEDSRTDKEIITNSLWLLKPLKNKDGINLPTTIDDTKKEVFWFRSDGSVWLNLNRDENDCIFYTRNSWSLLKGKFTIKPVDPMRQGYPLYNFFESRILTVNDFELVLHDSIYGNLYRFRSVGAPYENCQKILSK